MKVQTRRRQVVTRTEACLSSLSLKKTQPNNKNQTPKKERGGGGGQGEISWRRLGYVYSTGK